MPMFADLSGWLRTGAAERARQALEDELESKEELTTDPAKPAELKPDPPELNPVPLDPRLAKLVGGALLLPRVAVDPKSKLEESRLEPKELSLCCCSVELVSWIACKSMK